MSTDWPHGQTAMAEIERRIENTHAILDKLDRLTAALERISEIVNLDDDSPAMGRVNRVRAVLAGLGEAVK